MNLEIVRTTAARKALGLSHGHFYVRLKQGLVPQSVALGKRARGYSSDVLERVARAMVAGWTDEKIATLVSETEVVESKIEGGRVFLQLD